MSTRTARLLALGCMVAFMATLLVGCVEPVQPDPPAAPTDPFAKLQILDFSLQPYDNMFMPWVIIGHAKNVSAWKLSYAEVHGQFYDASNVLLADWIDNTSDLPAGVTWEFQIHLMDASVAERVDHATVTVGSCW
jgi:hypothetical protein